MKTIIKILIILFLALIILPSVNAAYKREVYDYQGSHLREKVNYSLIDSDEFTGGNATLENVTADWFSWTEDSPYLSWTGSVLSFVESLMNSSIIHLIGTHPTGNTTAELTTWIGANRSENVVFDENVTADYFLGDGSQLYGIQTGELVFFLHDESSSDIANSKRLESNRNDTSTQTLQFSTLSDNDDLQNWTTEVGIPHVDFLLGGVYAIHIHARVTSGSAKDTALYFKLWKIDSSGANHVLIGTSEDSNTLTDSFVGSVIHLELDDTLIELTDRLILQAYVDISGSGSTPTVELQIEGDSGTRIEINVPGVNIATFVPYSGAVNSVDLGKYNITTSDTMHSQSFNATKNITSMNLNTYGIHCFNPPTCTARQYWNGSDLIIEVV